ncbi:MAG: hypothetical protein WCA27_30060 [Candidatus Sulfotelmatobacter sp.]
MSVRRSSGGSGAVSRGRRGLGAVKQQDRAPGVAQARAVPESNHDLLRDFLNGEAWPRRVGFDCQTAEKRLFVPYHLTSDPATALALCKVAGLVIQKLDALETEHGMILYACTLPKPQLEN